MTLWTLQTELEQELDKAKRKFAENEKSLTAVEHRLSKLELHDLGDDDDDEEENAEAAEKPADELRVLSEEELEELDAENLKAEIALLEGQSTTSPWYSIHRSS